MGGGKSIIDALVRGLEKNGGRLMLQTHVDQVSVAYLHIHRQISNHSVIRYLKYAARSLLQVIVEDGEAKGVKLQPKGRRRLQSIR
jgi:phytoene dehydrogenase-like protein